MEDNELWKHLFRNLYYTEKEHPLKIDVLIKKEHKSYYVTEIWRENNNIFYKVENLDNKFNLSKESVEIQKQIDKEINDIIYDNKTILPYLQHGEKCYCLSKSWNDAQTPDYWKFKGYNIYITQEGLFDIDCEDSNKNTTFSTLKEAIEFIKNNKNLKQC